MIQDLNVLWVVRQLCPNEQTRAAISPLPTLSANQTENLWQRLKSPAVSTTRLELPFPVWGALLEQEDWQQQLVRQRREDTQRETVAQVSTNLS